MKEIISSPDQVLSKIKALVFPSLPILAAFMFLTVLAGGNIGASSILLIALAVPVVIGLFFKGFTTPFPILLALVVYIPFSKVMVGNVGGIVAALNFTNVLILLAGISWVTGVYRGRRLIWTTTPLDRPILVLILFACFALFGTGLLLADVLVEFKRWLTPFLIYFIFSNMVQTRDEAKKIVITILIGVIASALLGIKEFVFEREGRSWEKTRIRGLAEQPNSLGAFYVYYLFIFAGLAVETMPSLYSYLLWIPFLLTTRALLYTGSRGAFVAAVAGWAFYCFLGLFRKKVFLLLVTVFVVFIILLFPDMMPESITYQTGRTTTGRMESSGELGGNLEKSAGNRILFWRGAMGMIQDHPFGVGISGFSRLLPEYVLQETGTKIPPRDAHNMYLLMAAEMGVLSVCVLFIIFFRIGKHAILVFRKERDPFFRGVALGSFAGLIGLLVANIFGNRFYDVEVVGYFWMLTAVLFRIPYLK